MLGQIALAALSVSQFVMIATTSTSPVYLYDQGHSVRIIGIGVSLHLGGMYVASPLSGWLCDRFGRLLMIGVGALILIGAVMLAGLAPGTDPVLVIGALFLNGVGWNLAFVSASALLTDALAPAERASVQGFADLIMGLMGAVGSAVGGMVLGIWGFLVTWIPFFIGLVLGGLPDLLAVVFGILGIVSANASGGRGFVMALIGLILGGLAFLSLFVGAGTLW